MMPAIEAENLTSKWHNSRHKGLKTYLSVQNHQWLMNLHQGTIALRNWLLPPTDRSPDALSVPEFAWYPYSTEFLEYRRWKWTLRKSIAKYLARHIVFYRRYMPLSLWLRVCSPTTSPSDCLKNGVTLSTAAGSLASLLFSVASRPLPSRFGRLARICFASPLSSLFYRLFPTRGTIDHLSAPSLSRTSQVCSAYLPARVCGTPSLLPLSVLVSTPRESFKTGTVPVESIGWYTPFGVLHFFRAFSRAFAIEFLISPSFSLLSFWEDPYLWKFLSHEFPMTLLISWMILQGYSARSPSREVKVKENKNLHLQGKCPRRKLPAEQEERNGERFAIEIENMCRFDRTGSRKN